jgi:nicotinic acid mononucleotide adenylyltransferase
MLFVAVGMFSAVPVFAAHHEMMKDQKMMMEHEGARQCALQAESIQQKIQRIQGEIKQGSKKYTAEELKKLEEKLKEANETLDNLMKR